MRWKRQCRQKSEIACQDPERSLLSTSEEVLTSENVTQSLGSMGQIAVYGDRRKKNGIHLAVNWPRGIKSDYNNDRRHKSGHACKGVQLYRANKYVSGNET
jgi:hypothetical protein